MKTLILIPCYNDNKFIPQLINGIKLHSSNNILIIDDCSDEPINLVDENISILRNEKNLGKGATLLRGFDYALKHCYTHVLTVDSDMQHLPKDIPDFELVDPSVDLVVGSRNFDTSMPIHRKFSNFLTSLIISTLTNHKIYDSQCGFRRYKMNSINDLNFKYAGFQFESELLLKLLTNKSASVEHVDVHTVYGEESSSINNVLDTIKFIKLIFLFLCKKL